MLPSVVVVRGQSGPLSWGRVAALLISISSAMSAKDKARLQCFVDDFVLISVGSIAKRVRNKRIVVVFLRTSGYNLSWSKGARGPFVEWIGAQIAPWTSQAGKNGVLAALPSEKIEKRCY